MNRNLSNDVTKYIKGKADQLVTVEEITTDLNLDAAQVRYAMRRLIEKTSLGRFIKVVNRGHAWQVGAIPGAKKEKAVPVEAVPTIMDWSGTPAPAPLGTYEQVGVSGDGSPIARGNDGKLWRLTAL